VVDGTLATLALDRPSETLAWQSDWQAPDLAPSPASGNLSISALDSLLAQANEELCESWEENW
jgi:hypothetical protein